FDAIKKTKKIVGYLNVEIKKMNKFNSEKEEKKKQDEEEKPDEEKKKQEEDEETAEEKRKEDAAEDEEEKKKEEGEPKPGEAEIKLPKAPAGETDESAPPEGDKVNILEKKLGEVVKRLDSLVKSGDIIKSRTPRSMHEVAKRREVRKTELALDMLEKAKLGKLSVADMNRQIKGLVRKNNDEAMKTFFEKVHNDKEVA
ncbi:hypothetical protein LCGC14_2822540, partial [marine sediment metagenome]